jgi:hypothetical protein
MPILLHQFSDLEIFRTFGEAYATVKNKNIHIAFDKQKANYYLLNIKNFQI